MKKSKNARYKSMRDKAEEYLEALRRALDKAEKLDDILISIWKTEQENISFSVQIVSIWTI